LKASFEMMNGVDPVDGVDDEKTYLRGCVHFVHNVHSVHYSDKFIWLPLPNLGSQTSKPLP